MEKLDTPIKWVRKPLTDETIELLKKNDYVQTNKEEYGLILFKKVKYNFE
jgi:hypothetical protein